MVKGLSKNVGEIKDWVEIYSKQKHLLKPEEIVLEQLKARLPSMRMLDIGVGGGRTTSQFAELAKEYIGIDFDDSMLQVCNRKFSDNSGKISFINCDARSMTIFSDNYFDFVLFSFNGIDYLSHEDRLRALREIGRVGKIGGYFLFSTHNLNSIDKLFTLSFSRNPIKLFIQLCKNPKFLSKALWKHFILTLRNEDIKKLRTQEYAIIYDGVYSHKLRWLILSIWKRLGYNYYSKPEEQLRQLKKANFQIIKIYALDGKVITDEVELGTIRDYWLYYFCHIVG